MADFKLAIPFILKHEGGYAETPAGEVVNRGVNTDTLKALGYPGTKDELKQIVKNLTVEQTEDIYNKFYWTFKKPSITNGLDLVKSQPVGSKILDMAVLSGQHTAIKLVQRAAGLKEDGYFGQGTLDAVNAQGDAFVQNLITTWSASLSDIADHRIAEAKAKDDEKLTHYWERVKIGWLARASWNGQ
jgi:lysozyme family protein